MFRQDETLTGETQDRLSRNGTCSNTKLCLNTADQDHYWGPFTFDFVFKHALLFILWNKSGSSYVDVTCVDEPECCTGTAAAAQASVISAHLCFTLSFTVNELQSLSMFHVQEKDKAWKAKGCEYYMTAV